MHRAAAGTGEPGAAGDAGPVLAVAVPRGVGLRVGAPGGLVTGLVTGLPGASPGEVVGGPAAGRGVADVPEHPASTTAAPATRAAGSPQTRPRAVLTLVITITC